MSIEKDSFSRSSVFKLRSALKRFLFAGESASVLKSLSIYWKIPAKYFKIYAKKYGYYDNWIEIDQINENSKMLNIIELKQESYKSLKLSLIE